eukprot:Skav230724  [mRNA]  locus=scaffold401:82641:87275:- [translate_table: standard]
MGKPVQPKARTVSAIGGKQSGVGFLSSGPSRTMTMPAMPDNVDPCRVHVASFHCGNRTIQGGVIYGFASQPTTLATKQATDRQCQVLTERLVDNNHGLRFIGGDFNQEDPLPSMQYWMSKGWINIQQWALEVHQQPIQVTCKGATTPDHLYVSPELARYLSCVKVEDDWFPDHSILFATFTNLGAPPQVPLWRTPVQFQWPSLEQENQRAMQEPRPTAQSTPEAQYAQIWENAEARAERVLRSQGQPMHKSAKGRAQTMEVKWVQEYTTPMRPSRHGEPTPEYHVPNLQYTQWYRQLRRLVNWQRLSSTDSLRASQHEQVSALWHRILTAPGFSGSFPRWWAAQFPTGPSLIGPRTTKTQAEQVVTAFEKQLKHWEKHLLEQRVNKAKQRRIDNPNVIFKDLRAEPQAPVQMLIDRPHTKVAEVDAAEAAIVLEQPQDWTPDQPIHVAGTLHHPIHVEADKLWLPDVSSIQPGDMVSQETYIGNLGELFRRFEVEWKQRWDKHMDVDPSRWKTLLDFADAALPQVPPMQCTPITYQEWCHAVRSKPSHAATGPDGASRSDLLALPQDLVMELLAIFESIEQGSPWPIQLLEGFIVALAKVPDAHQVQQYRPIVVFPVAYRVWSSIRARQILRHLCEFCPQTCRGNLPHRAASDVWHAVLGDIEASNHHTAQLSGGVVDIIKAFNVLPRQPVFHILERLQVAPCILVAWKNGLARLRRRFKVRSAIGPPVTSVTGYPEGCALSVVSMLALNILGHTWARLRYPHITLWSYVDNLEIVGPTPELVHQGMQGLSDFCTLVDLPIDHGKTYTWSLDGAGRKLLTQDYQVKRYARDLGGHMTYTKQNTNQTIRDKLALLPSLWGRLARSLAPYRAKLRALRTKAWPAALHAIASAHLGDANYTPVRAGCTEALGLQGPGFSAIAHLSLVEPPGHDPQCYALVATIAQFRMHHNDPDRVDFVMQSLHSMDSTQLGPGPCSVLLARLHQINWGWSPAHGFHDQWGKSCDLLRAPFQEVLLRATQAWQQKVQTQLSSRKTMEGLQYAMPALTTANMKKHQPEEQALLARCLNGTFWAADHLQHVRPEAHEVLGSACRFCGAAEDSQIHRHWHCPHFDDCRPFSKPMLEKLASLPSSFTAHGWIPTPPALQEFRQMCSELPDDTECCLFPPCLPETLHMFTDGACKAPTCQHSRLAAWGCVLADVTSNLVWPISHGVLPGWYQSSLRAEILAAIAACKFAVCTGRPIVLWVDNDLVFRRCKQFQRGTSYLKPNQKDADLWMLLQQQITRLDQSFLAIMKVVSHQVIHDHTPEDEAWIFRANHAADRLAEAAYAKHPALMQVWTTLRDQLEHAKLLRDQTHTMMIAIGKKAVLAPNPATTSIAPKPDAIPKSIQRPELQEIAFPHMTVHTVPRKYHCDMLKPTLQSLAQLTSPNGTVRCVSWIQLNVMYERFTASKGVKYITKDKQWASALAHTQDDALERTSSLSAYVQGMWSCHGLRKGSAIAHLRSSSSILTYWTRCVPVRMDAHQWQQAEEMLREKSEHLATAKEVRLRL